MNDDVLEESERSSIRGTLLHLASKLQVKSASGVVNNIDPYMREVRIWIRMACLQVRCAKLCKKSLV